jgi:hypothetical protein
LEFIGASYGSERKEAEGHNVERRMREIEKDYSEQREMDISNRPVTSREYKLIRNMDRFKDREQTSEEFLSLLKFLVKKELGSVVEEQHEEQRRQTSYLDTPEGTLHQKGFALRLREEIDDEKEFQINLKYRASDRDISAAQDLSSAQEGETKFEEDVLPPFISKFSHSTIA